MTGVQTCALPISDLSALHNIGSVLGDSGLMAKNTSGRTPFRAGKWVTTNDPGVGLDENGMRVIDDPRTVKRG